MDRAPVDRRGTASYKGADCRPDLESKSRSENRMFDLKWIRDCPDDFDAALRRRGLPPQAQEVLALDRRRRDAQTVLRDMRTRRNAASKAIGEARRKGGNADGLMAEVSGLKGRIADVREFEKRWAGPD